MWRLQLRIRRVVPVAVLSSADVERRRAHSSGHPLPDAFDHLRAMQPPRTLQRGEAHVQHADATLPDLLVTLADCPKARSANIYDRCRAVYETAPL